MEKGYCRTLVSEIIFTLRSCDAVFHSILHELIMNATTAQRSEYVQFDKIARCGWKIMNKTDDFMELKMMKIEIMNDRMLNVIFSFIEITLKKLFSLQLKELDESKNSSFAQSKSGTMKIYFSFWKEPLAIMSSKSYVCPGIVASVWRVGFHELTVENTP